MVYYEPQSYYNSMDLDYEQIMVFLAMGQRQPQNEKEERLLKQIREIEGKGNELDIPFNGL